MTSREIDPYAGRPAHPYVDKFTNEWAWRFEDGFNGLAAASNSPDDFQHRLAVMWQELRGHDEEMAKAWVAFCGRKFGDELERSPLEAALRVVEAAHNMAGTAPDESDPVSRLRAALARTDARRGPEPEPPTVGTA